VLLPKRGRAYKANAAKTRAATTLPRVMVLRAPELAVTREGVALAVELPEDEVAMERVVWAGVVAMVVMPALTLAGPVPAMSTADAVDVPETVTKAT
jgi:hypothetical protein